MSYSVVNVICTDDSYRSIYVTVVLQKSLQISQHTKIVVPFDLGPVSMAILLYNSHDRAHIIMFTWREINKKICNEFKKNVCKFTLETESTITDLSKAWTISVKIIEYNLRGLRRVLQLSKFSHLGKPMYISSCKFVLVSISITISEMLLA